jgi:hypothetical protein
MTMKGVMSDPNVGDLMRYTVLELEARHFIDCRSIGGFQTREGNN